MCSDKLLRRINERYTKNIVEFTTLEYYKPGRGCYISINYPQSGTLVNSDCLRAR